MRDGTKCVITPMIDETGYKALGPAVHRASTIVFDNAEAYATRTHRGPDGFSYGLYGTPTSRALTARITAISGGVRTFLAPSGQGGNAIAFCAVLSDGDHVLLPDNCYPAMRTFASNELKRFGIATEFYDPTSIDDLKARLRPETALIWCESPGSSTLEVQDLRAIAALAQEAGVLTGIDNTWGTCLGLKPIAFGFDIVVEALTKYAAGHSDVLMGAITVRTEELSDKIWGTLGRLGIGVSSDDCALVLRGMETMPLRLAQSTRGAEQLIPLLQASPAVEKVLWPALPDDPGHKLWQRDFTAAAGVFSVLLAEGASARLYDALNELRTFAIGASWGGTRSLIAPMSVASLRTVCPWECEDLVLRISVGIEDISDLKEDICSLLTALEAP
jgi:cystathionine beta-lyase